MIQDRTTPASGVPTRARYVTTVFAMTLAVVMSIDRVVISQAAPLISADLGLTKIQMGWALSAFGWAGGLCWFFIDAHTPVDDASSFQLPASS